MEERRFKSRNVDDYIKDADEKAIKERYKPFLCAIGGAVVLGVGIIGFAYFNSHKKPQKSYDELVNATPTPVVVADEKAETKDKSSFLDLFMGKDKNKTVDRTLPIYTTVPSNEILAAEPDSGSVQIGDYLFVLPCKLTAFMDVGFEVIGWGPHNSNPEFSLDMIRPKHSGAEILIRYDENSVYAAYIYDTEEVTIMDSTVVSLSQSTEENYFTPQALPLFAAGGVHVGLVDDVVDEYFNQFENYHTNEFGYRIYNGPVRLDMSPNNLISMASDTDLHELKSLRVFKNY